MPVPTSLPRILSGAPAIAFGQGRLFVMLMLTTFAPLASFQHIGPTKFHNFVDLRFAKMVILESNGLHCVLHQRKLP